MTSEPAGASGLRLGGSAPTGASPGAAARELGAAAESVAGALRGLASADGVDWVSTAAVRYRAVLTEATATLHAARNLLDEAMAAVAAHGVAVELSRSDRRRDVAGQLVGASQPAGWEAVGRSLDLRRGTDPW